VTIVIAPILSGRHRCYARIWFWGRTNVA